MKKSSIHFPRFISVFSLIILLSTSASSICLYSQKCTIIAVLETQEMPTTIHQKIRAILDRIDETLILQYLQTIVGYGLRKTGTYGCEKAAQYISQQSSRA